jgi:hypothetical protein
MKTTANPPSKSSTPLEIAFITVPSYPLEGENDSRGLPAIFSTIDDHVHVVCQGNPDANANFVKLNPLCVAKVP